LILGTDAQIVILSEAKDLFEAMDSRSFASLRMTNGELRELAAHP
jgi:hypothetical protein